MRDNYTRIAVVLDRSGSMDSCKESTVAGFNSFIEEQKKLPGEVKLKLVQFDDKYEYVFDQLLKDVQELTQSTFIPRGTTALLDAQGRTIEELGQELGKLPESERPSKVIVVTMTDGLENASRKFTAAKIGEMVAHQRDVYGWEFVFLGANQDAIATAATMNIPMASAMSYSVSRAGVANTMAAVSKVVGNYRRGIRGQSAGFSAEDRLKAMEEDKLPVK